MIMNIFTMLTQEFFNKYLLVTNIICMPFFFFFMEQGCGLSRSGLPYYTEGLASADFKIYLVNESFP